MTTVSILPEQNESTAPNYRAMAGTEQSVGRTPGEALDSLTSKLSERDSGAVVVIQRMKPDRFFNEQQQKRLAELMQRWRLARDQGKSLGSDEQAELDQLVQAEVKASAERVVAMRNEIKVVSLNDELGLKAF
jgi:hypothetical protein